MTYPKGEIVWIRYYNLSGELIYIITSKASREFYFIYEFVDSEFRKLGKSRSPTELEEKYRVHEQMYSQTS